MYNRNLHFHFVGIGGSGMSGIAEILLTLGFKVSGSDLKCSTGCSRLSRLGAEIYEGHSAENLPVSASLVVYSSAVGIANPEILEAKRRALPVVRRAEVLAELMRLKYGIAVAGSHGKTTTTSLIAHVLERAGLDPTAVIGGVVSAFDSGGKLGRGEYLVAESDESDKSFLLLRPTIAVVTNIDAEHVNAYGSIEELEKAFASFIDAVPFYGVSILCMDDPRVQKLAQAYRGRKVGYGQSAAAQIRAVNLTHERALMRYELLRDQSRIGVVRLPVPGTHAVVNSLAAVAVGLELGLDVATIIDGLASFQGVKRRSEIVGEVAGVTFISDYGHHPTEILATIAAIKAGWSSTLRRLHVVFQPHRYSRTHDCFSGFIEAFHQADTLVITDIYGAGEQVIDGVNAEVLCKSMSNPSPYHVPILQQAIPLILPMLDKGDVVLCLGAGSIGTLAESFVEAFKDHLVSSENLREAHG